VTFRDGLGDPRQIGELLRPLQLDLEATFKAMRDDVMREIRVAVRQGVDPTEAISRALSVIGDDDA